MKKSLKAVGAAIAAASAIAGVLVVSSAAQATSAVPPYEPDATDQFGQITFYDASGNQVTSGLVTDAPFAAYAVATSSDPITTNTKATLYGYLPVNGVAPGAWSGKAMTGGTTFPVTSASAPAVVTGAGANTPVVTLSSSDLTLAGLQATYPNNATDAYKGLYQLRIKTFNNTQYWAADIFVDASVSPETWTQVYPTPASPSPTPTGTPTPTASPTPTTSPTPSATSTTTALGVAPASPGYVGQTATLTATLSPSNAVGTVQFMDNGNAVGAPVAVTNGQAQLQKSDLTQGSHTLAADFTPTDPSTFGSSSSSNVSYTVLGAPAWKPFLAGAHRVGMVDSCLAAFDNNPTVTYAWSVNGVTVSGASAATYLLPETAYGKKVACTVSASNPAGTQSATSSSYTVGVGPALVPTTRPYLYGTHTHGAYEYAYPGKWSPAATSYLYQWYVGTYKISGATGYRFLVPSTWKGKTIKCVVIARRTYWTNGVYTTPAVLVS